SGDTGGNSGTPESTVNILKPHTPSATNPAISASEPGTNPPQKATSQDSWEAAACRFAASADRSMVGGIEFNGMSAIVVVPPATDARVAVPNPSHPGRPVSSTCTCESSSPGKTPRSP